MLKTPGPDTATQLAITSPSARSSPQYSMLVICLLAVLTAYLGVNHTEVVRFCTRAHLALRIAVEHFRYAL